MNYAQRVDLISSGVMEVSVGGGTKKKRKQAHAKPQRSEGGKKAALVIFFRRKNDHIFLNIDDRGRFIEAAEGYTN